jgi:tetratricopeptide (TPR) repeat protein
MTNLEEQREREQDERIAANTKAIQEQTQYLHEIRDQIIPEEEARLKRFARIILMPFVKILALITFIAGVWDFFMWFLDRYEVKEMADRYVEVAQDLYYDENNPDIAMNFLDKAIDLCGGDAEYRFLRSYMEGMGAMTTLADLDRPFKKEELDRVHHAYAEAKFLEGLEPKRAEPYLLQAQVLMLLKETDRAEALLRKAIKLEGDDDFVYLRLVQLYLMKGDTKSAADELDQAQALNPKSKWVYIWRGVLLGEYQKDYTTARQFFEKALEIDPKFDIALNALGWSYLKPKEKCCSKAREAFLKTLKVNPASQKACCGIGISYAYELNPGVAKMWFDKAIQLDADYLSAYKYRGMLNAEMEDYESAVSDFNAALLLDPMNADLYVQRALPLTKLNRLNEALRDLYFALDIEPNAPRTLYYLGCAHALSGDDDSALDYYQKALANDPDFDEVYESEARLFAKRGQRDEALAAIDKAIQCASANPAYYHISKGNLLKQFEDWKGALASFEKACELQPKEATSWMEVYRLAQKLGEKDKAQKALKTYLQLCPMDTEAKKLLQP